MTKFDIYDCDRCRKEIRQKAGEQPSRIVKTYRGDDEATYDLCVDCDASFAFFMENVKRFDALAETIVVESESKEPAIAP